jgi:hypothetical protein
MLNGQVFGPGGIPLPNVESMGGEYGPLGRRHSGKGRAVPVRCPSIARCSSRSVSVVSLLMLSSRSRAHRAVLISALCAGATFAHAQGLASIESLSESYVTCVQSAFARRMDESAANIDLPQATERALLDCEIEENVLYTTAVSSTPGNTQAIALVRAAVGQLKANLKAELMGAPPTRSPKK